MVSQRKNTFIYIIIFLGLFLALVPVILSNDYLRQDDMKTGLYYGMRMSGEGYLYYNTMHQLVRPICMVLFFLIDMISINLHHAVYVRLASIINVGILGILLFRWQMLFNSNRLLAATFAIAAFTLPGIQLSAATANYFLMIFGLLLAFAGPFYWYKAFNAVTTREKRKNLWLGCGIFFLSFLDYPMSSMYAWVMLGIVYLNSLIAVPGVREHFRRFFYYASFLTIALMGFYFVFMHLYHWIGHIDMNYGRVGTSNLLTLISRSVWIFDIFRMNSYLWFDGQDLPYHAPVLLIVLFMTALLKLKFAAGSQSQYSFKDVWLTPLIMFFVFAMCYSPALAAPDDGVGATFRYTIATMPILLYVIFWSVSVIVSNTNQAFFARAPQFAASLLLVAVTAFSIYYSNIMTADGIVGPQDSDYRFLEAQLKEKVVPLLQQNKLVALHVVDCDHGKEYKFAKGIPTALEYSMRLCVFPHHLVGAVNHSLRALGYSSNKRHLNYAFSDGNLFVLNDVPWGNIIVNSTTDYDMSHLDYPKDQMTLVTIDMRDAPTYQPMGLYKRVFGL